MELKIPKLTAIKYMVMEGDKQFRGFETKKEAEEFVRGDDSLTIVKMSHQFHVIEVEEAPF